MKDTINGETVFVCEMHEEGRRGYHDRGEWHVMGVVADLEDAARWAHGHEWEDRRFTWQTVGIVSDRV